MFTANSAEPTGGVDHEQPNMAHESEAGNEEDSSTLAPVKSSANAQENPT